MSSIEYKTTPPFIAEYQTSHDWTLEYGTSNFNQVAREKIERNKLAELNKWFGIFSCTKLIEDLKRQDKEYLDNVVKSGVFPDPKESLRYHVVFYMDKALPLPNQKSEDDKTSSFPEQKESDDNCISIPDQVHSSVLKVLIEWSEARGFQLQKIRWVRRYDGAFHLEILVLPEPSQPLNDDNVTSKSESVKLTESFDKIKFVKTDK